MILLLESEVKRIADETSLNADCFASNVDGFKPYMYVMTKTMNGQCFFLRDKLCSIYECRPLICRFYPFQLVDLGGNHYLFKETSECPGVNKGSYLGKQFFKKMFEKATSLMRDEEIK